MVLPLVVYASRWWMLLVYALSTATSAILWITFSPVADLTQTYYNVDTAHVNGLSIVFMGAYVPFTMVSSWVFSRYGIRRGFVVASVLNLLAGGMRYASTATTIIHSSPSFAMLMMGQTMGAMAQPFFTNMPARLGAIWFPQQERDLAVVVAFLANILGTAVGSVLPAAFSVTTTTVTHYTEEDGTNDTTTMTTTIRMHDLLGVEFILTLLMALVVAGVYQEKPPTPPSRSESYRTNENDNGDGVDVQKQLYQLVTNKDFMILVVSTGCLSLGLLNSLVTILEQLIAPVGYDSDDASLFSGVCIVSGILCSILMGALMDHTHAYNLLLKVGLVLSVVALGFFFWALRPGQTAVVAVMTCLVGMTMLPLLPLAMECACECTYPISEDLSSGILMSAGQVMGMLLLFVLDDCCLEKEESPSRHHHNDDGDDDDNDTYHYKVQLSYKIFMGGAIVAMAIGSMYNGKYLRLEADQSTDDDHPHSHRVVQEPEQLEHEEEEPPADVATDMT
eukprot:scaffold14974_cov195-Amphora_coffeaeformis.AAC.42